MVAKQTHDVTEMTGFEIQLYLTKLASSESWKGGAKHLFQFQMDKHTLTLFEVKAMKTQNPIEEVLLFHQASSKPCGFSWDDARDFLENQDFVKYYYDKFLVKNLHMLVSDIQEMTEFLRICFSLSFEIARCSLVRSDRDEFIQAIFTALETEVDDVRRSENISDLCKMFPKKIQTVIEKERRQHALDCINRRRKMDQIKQINKIWPQGENAADLMEILSEDPIKRKCAFDKFIERKEQFEDVLLKQNPNSLTFFESILTANDEEEARRAFEQLELSIEKRPTA